MRTENHQLTGRKAIQQSSTEKCDEAQNSLYWRKNTQEKRSCGEGQEISGNTSENTEATMENIPALKTKRV